jgi:serine/threonine-protein kinase
VRRWEEKESLPVHRQQHDKRGSVYAYRWELDEWRESRRQLMEVENQPAIEVGGRRLRWALGLALLVAASAGGYWMLRRAQPGNAEYTPSPEAYRAYVRGHFGENAGRVQVQAGIKNYQEAIRLDPRFARAWGGLATAHIALTWFGDVPARETMAQAKLEAQKALSLDSRSGAAWRVLAFVAHYLDWDQSSAEKQYRKALELNPREAVAASWFAEFLLDMRRYDEALVYTKKAQDIAPRWLEPVAVAGNIHAFSGNPDLAIPEYQRALEIEPNYGLANHFLGRAYLAKGQTAKAIEQLRRSNELLGGVPFSMGDLGYALGIGGHGAEAQKMLAEMNRKRQAGYYPAFAIAQVELGLGHMEASLDWLERAADERHMGYYLPSADPIYQPLRTNPRFLALTQQMHTGTPSY